MKIDGINLDQGLGAALGGASTPEEAAQLFMGAASQGLAKVMSDALVAALGQTVGAGNPPDWAQLITGLTASLDWATPANTTPRRIVALADASGGPALGGVGVSIGISANF